ncbi:HD domain-containing phosphohydrolase [Methylobacter sp. G7]|uniref:HD domain-containing phosphohydrolase n=1 Tax=Methylobacter sp. G7 TaxID=3230117 RepID=UPI003D80A0B5
MHTLLLVDDDPDVLATLTRSFRKGYKTLSASGGAEGIAFLNEHPVDLIICDQRMPNISGDQVLSHALQARPHAIRILLTGYADVESLLTCVNEAHIYKYVTKPWDPAELNLTVVRALESLVLKRDLETARDQLETAYKDAVVMLCLAAEGKDQDTASHLYRVQHYTEALAIAMGVDAAEAAHMGFMSMLHDIGKLATPDAILKKPDKLTAEEWDIMREHPLAGVRILGNNPFYECAREISAGHHENYDGSGYPHGLIGENIPLSARIVKIADVFDALTTKRPYKEPWSMETAITHIEAHASIMFDPAMVEALKKLFADGTLLRIMTADYV